MWRNDHVQDDFTWLRSGCDYGRDLCNGQSKQIWRIGRGSDGVQDYFAWLR